MNSRENPFFNLGIASYIGFCLGGMWMGWSALQLVIKSDHPMLNFVIPLVCVLSTIAVTGSSDRFWAHYFDPTKNRYVATILILIWGCYTSFDLVTNAIGFSQLFTNKSAATFTELWNNCEEIPTFYFLFGVFLVVNTCLAPMMVVWFMDQKSS